MEVYQRGDVLLPWLHIVRIHRHFLGLVGVFVGQSGEGVTKLVYHHWAEPFLVAGGQVV